MERLSNVLMETNADVALLKKDIAEGKDFYLYVNLNNIDNNNINPMFQIYYIKTIDICE